MSALIAYCVSFLSRLFRGSIVQKSRYSDAIQPFVKHKTLSYEEFKLKDILVVGDVHGCYDEAMELLKKVESETSRKFVTIFVGDMVNKGPKNFEMLDFLRQREDVYCVRGNHEQAILRIFLAMKESVPDDLKPHKSNNWFSKLTPAQFEYIRNLPYTISIPLLQMIVVHAGFIPHKPLHEQDDHDMLHMRGLVWVKDDFHGKVLTPTESIQGDLWAQCWPGPEHVYFGHDAITRLQRQEHCTGLDTGCLYGGKLTAVLIEVPENISGPVKHSSLKRKFFTIDAKKPHVKVN